MCDHCCLNWPSDIRALVGPPRASMNGDCLVPMYKTSFGQSVFSAKGAKLWNLLPTSLKLETNSNTFNRELKQRLKSNQQCSHK